MFICQLYLNKAVGEKIFFFSYSIKKINAPKKHKIQTGLRFLPTDIKC